MNAPLQPLSSMATFDPSPLSELLGPLSTAAFVPMSAMSESGVVVVKDVRLAAELTKGYTYFQDGDVLVAKITPCFENGKIGHFRTSERHAFGSTEFHVVRPESGTLDARYLHHFLRTSQVRAAGEKRMTGSAGQRRVPRDFLKQLPIPVPAISEQRRIAAILDQAEASRSKRRQALAKLDTLTQSLFLEMFGDPRTNRKGWSTAAFGNVGVLDRGVSQHRPRNAPELLGGVHPLVQTGEITRCDGYIRSFTNTYSDLGLRQSRLWPAGTLCITIAANIGNTAILTFPACFPDSVVGFTPSGFMTVEYVQTWMSFMQKHLEDNAPAFAQKNINLGILKTLVIPVPPLDLQRSLSSRRERLVNLRNRFCFAEAKEETLFASLQHRAFHGEL